MTPFFVLVITELKITNSYEVKMNKFDTLTHDHRQQNKQEFNIIFAENLDKVADRNTSRFITDVHDSEPVDMH